MCWWRLSVLYAAWGEDLQALLRVEKYSILQVLHIETELNSLYVFYNFLQSAWANHECFDLSVYLPKAATN